MVPITQLLGRRVVGRRRDPGRVQQDLAQRHIFFAVAAELRPHLGDPELVVQLPTFHQDMRNRGRNPLRGRCRIKQRVPSDGGTGVLVCEATYRIDDQFSAIHHRDLHADLGAGCHHRVDGALDAPLHVPRGNPEACPCHACIVPDTDVSRLVSIRRRCARAALLG